jgi:hypothetical protein
VIKSAGIDETDNGMFQGVFMESALLSTVKTIKRRDKQLGRALGTPAGPRLHILAVGPEARGIIFIRFRDTNIHAHLCQGGNGRVSSRISKVSSRIRFRGHIGPLRDFLSQLAGQFTGKLQLPR